MLKSVADFQNLISPRSIGAITLKRSLVRMDPDKRGALGQPDRSTVGREDRDAEL